MTFNKSLKSILPIALLLVLFLVIVLYAKNRTSLLSQGVDLSIEDIFDGKVFEDTTVHLKGFAKRAVLLTINTDEVLIDETGKFEKTLVFVPGYNTVTVEAKDKYGDYKQLEYQIWQKPKPEESPPELLARYMTQSRSVIQKSEDEPQTENNIPDEGTEEKDETSIEIDTTNLTQEILL